MGQLLVDQELVPDLIIASSARRARQTASRVAKASGFIGTITEDPTLYLNGPEAYLAAASAVDDGTTTLMLVGHNPDCEQLIRLLCGRDERMPTAALAQIELPVDSWHEIASVRGSAILANLWRPRELPDGMPP